MLPVHGLVLLLLVLFPPLPSEIVKAVHDHRAPVKVPQEGLAGIADTLARILAFVAIFVGGWDQEDGKGALQWGGGKFFSSFLWDCACVPLLRFFRLCTASLLHTAALSPRSCNERGEAMPRTSIQMVSLDKVHEQKYETNLQGLFSLPFPLFLCFC